MADNERTMYTRVNEAESQAQELMANLKALIEKAQEEGKTAQATHLKSAANGLERTLIHLQYARLTAGFDHLLVD